MKKIISVVLIGVLLVPCLGGISYARHRGCGGWGGNAGWAAAGGLLGGMILGAAMSQPRYNYYYPAPVYYGQPVYYSQPAYYYPRYYTYPSYTTYTTYTTTYAPDVYWY